MDLSVTPTATQQGFIAHDPPEKVYGHHGYHNSGWSSKDAAFFSGFRTEDGVRDILRDNAEFSRFNQTEHATTQRGVLRLAKETSDEVKELKLLVVEKNNETQKMIQASEHARVAESLADAKARIIKLETKLGI
jgi:hypothetical protein